MKGLITDREQRNVDRLKELHAKGWHRMTVAEQSEWMGNPLEATGVNLLPPGPYYSSAVELKYTNDCIIAKTNASGIYLYAISIIGNASDYEGKTFTLSADYMGTADGGTPQLALYWHDDNGYEYAGASLTSEGSATFDIFPNTGARAYLAMYVYVTTDATVEAGAAARFRGVMFEVGDVRHEYVPYTEILPTPTTKGAYNYSDLNRVERAVAEISDLAGLGLVAKTDWRMWDVPTVADMNRYLGNVKVLRSRYSSDITLPDSMEKLTYETANNIEKIILAAYTKVATA
jgi:hypothetical protein